METAQRLANEFSIAQATGADLRDIRDVRSAVEILRGGVAGTGPYADLIFGLRDVSQEDCKAATKHLIFNRGILRYQAPISYETAWTSGSTPLHRTRLTSSPSRHVAERTAQAVARVYGAAQVSAANLSNITDVESAVSALEDGIAGANPHSETLYRIAAVRPDIRFIAKKMLRFHDGDLHFIRNGDRVDGEHVQRIFDSNQPARLAQQIAAIYTSATTAGADFGDQVTVAQIVSALRTGVHASDDIGTQFFRIAAEGSESDWGKSLAYLRLQDGTITFSPPTGR